jgi:hypothetical protein
MDALTSYTDYGAGNMLMNAGIFLKSRQPELFRNYLPTAFFRNAYNIVQTQYIWKMKGGGNSTFL